MPNQHQIKIKGYTVKELRCKNDSCRALLGFDNIIIGVLIVLCSKCGHENIYHMEYKTRKREFITQLQTKFNQREGVK